MDAYIALVPYVVGKNTALMTAIFIVVGTDLLDRNGIILGTNFHAPPRRP